MKCEMAVVSDTEISAMNVLLSSHRDDNDCLGELFSGADRYYLLRNIDKVN